MYLASRPFVEFHVRRRVQALGNVRFLDDHDVVEPIAATPDRVTGVRLVDRATGDDTPLNADLVVDAMGRAARTPAFLEKLGYGRPEERRSTANATYSSQLLRIPEGAIAEKMVFFPGKSTRGALAAYEDGAWMLTAGRLAIDNRSADRPRRHDRSRRADRTTSRSGRAPVCATPERRVRVPLHRRRVATL